MRFFRRLAPLALATAIGLGAAGAPPAAAQMREALAPCQERSIGGKTIDGAVWRAMRFRPRAGTSCRFNMNLGTNTAILAVRVLKRPARGRLVRVSRNEMIYRAPSSRRSDTFAVAFRVKNLRGTGWVNVAFEAQPR